MANKLLSQECIDYCNITKSLSEIEDKLNDKILKIVELYDNYVDSIEHYSLGADNKTLEVVYEYSSHDDYGRDTVIIPVKWLDSDENEIIKLVEAKIEEEKRLKEEMRKKEEERQKKEDEKKERAEYRMLKAKYGKEEK